jgi:alpha-1,3-rhamnosyltransferase
MPLASFLVLSWNHESYVNQCLESLFNQSCQDFEIIYLDNCSIDDSYNKSVKLLGESNILYSCFKNSSPKSLTQNLNFLFAQSKGDYIIPLSADDWFTNDFLEKKIGYLKGKANIGLLSSTGWIYDQNTGNSIPIESKNFKRGKVYTELFTEDNVLCFIGCLYPRSVLEAIGAWDEDLLIEDLDMFIRISEHYDIDYIDEPLVFYRKIGSSAGHNIDFMIKGWLQYYEKYRGAKGVDMKAWLAKRYNSCAAVSIDKGDLDKAKELLKKSIRLKPIHWETLKIIRYLLRTYWTPGNSVIKTFKS